MSAEPDLMETYEFDGDPTVTIGVVEVEPVPVEANPVDRTLKLGSVLGKGGMAVVREAEQKVLQRKVAVKSGMGGRSDGTLVLEAKITGALEHPAILPIHDILVDDEGRPHIVMKRVDGAPWSQLISDPEAVRERFQRDDMLGWNLEVLIAVCHALEFAHDAGVIHRDLKPENVMVADYGQIYVLDWGIAVTTDPDQDRLPHVSTLDRLAGTPAYMAPEMVTRAGLATIGPPTDVYLLGGMLYRIATGRPPHRGLDLKTILDSIPSFEPSLPDQPELEEIVRKAMALDPADRYPDAGAFRKALEDFVARRGAVAVAERATASLERLLPLLESPDSSRVEVYDLFGQVRFGFLEALRTWPDSPLALHGLDRAVHAMAVWELDQGDDRAAEVLLAQLDEVPDGLVEQLDQVRSDRAQERAMLERIVRGRPDPKKGRPFKLTLVGILLVLWGTGPFLNTLAPWVDYATTTVFLAVAATLVVLGRRTIVATRRNRVMAGILIVGMTGNLLLTLGTLTGALDVVEMRHAVWAMDATLCTFAAVMYHPALALPAVLYAFGYLFSAPLDPVRPIVASLLNTVMGITGLYTVWKR